MLEDWLRDSDKPFQFMKKDIIKIWQNHADLYKKFKLRIYKLYKELKGE
jgi:hypothetical protein